MALRSPSAPLAVRPAGFEPDRAEVMNTVRGAPSVELENGVTFHPLVGGHNKARNLTTGIVTFAPGAALPCHAHPFPEAVSVLSGQAAVKLEGRCYHLEHLDTVCIPAGTPHEVSNLSREQPAVFHIAMAA